MGVDEKLAAIIIKYIDKYVAMSTNKEQVKRNLISQIRMNFSGFAFADLNGISGCVNSLGNVISIDSNLDDWLLENTIFHELTHQIARNEIRENEDDKFEFVQFNLGLKVSAEDNMEHSAMMRLKQWEVDGNNYVYNKGNDTLDEWITEWIPSKNIIYRFPEEISFAIPANMPFLLPVTELVSLLF